MSRFFSKKQIFFFASLVLFLSTTIPELRADSKKDQSNASDPTAPYSLTISGGISLGVYEAGLNWIIVETMRDYYLKEKLLKLEAITGASAGAINTLASAFRFCEAKGENEYGKVHKNLFRSIWIDVDIEDQMPDDLSGYSQLELAWDENGGRKLKDSLFSREKLGTVIGLFRKQASKPIYRKDCEIKIALIVTGSEPMENSFKTSTVPQSIKTQRFVIPLMVMGDTSSKESKTRLIFKNNTEYSEMKRIGSGYIYLPQQKSGEIIFDDVIRAALASSAFPIVFGRVEQRYCVPITALEEGSSRCPDGTRSAQGYFIDGGLFDNIPIGVAIELLENGTNGERRGKKNYIYMDPAKRRGSPADSDRRKKAIGNPGPSEPDSGSLTLIKQINTITPVFGTFTNQELYRSLSENFSVVEGDEINKNRFLLLTERFPPLTGNFIGHFGAFLDPNFRKYDYAAGVYDGLRNVVKYLCSPEVLSPENVHNFCPNGQQGLFKKMLNQYLPSNTQNPEVRQIKKLIRLFIEWEERGHVPQDWHEIEEQEPEAGKNSAEVIVFKVLNRLSDDDLDSDFDAFLKALRPYKSKFSHRLQSMIENPSSWKIDLLRRAIRRLIDLERSEEGEAVRILKMTSIMINSKKIPHNKKQFWSLSSIPDKEKNMGYRLAPDGIALDGMQTGIVVSWLGVPEYLIFDHTYGELDLSYHHQFKEIDDDRTYFASAGSSLRYGLNSIVFSSVGVGINGNINLEPSTKFGNKLLYGWEIGVGFLADKLRLTWGNRDVTRDYSGEDWTLRIGVTDIDSLIYLFVD